MENNIFDKEFKQKLKAFYCYEDCYRRTGRTTLQAQIILEVAIESGKTVYMCDHNNRGRQANDELAGYIKRLANEYNRAGMSVVTDINNNEGTVNAYLLSNPMSKGYRDLYTETRISPFPIEKLQERLQFLLRRKLLLL